MSSSFRSLCSGLAALALLALPAAGIAATAATAAAAPRYDASALQPSATYARFIVRYRDGSRELRSRTAAQQNLQAAVVRAGLDHSLRAADGTALPALRLAVRRRLATGAELVHASRRLGHHDALALMRAIAADPAVRHVEPDAIMHAIGTSRPQRRRAALGRTDAAPAAFPDDPPDDPYYAQYQWDLHDLTGGADVERAWPLASGSGVTVAVLDTGITASGDLDTALGDAGYDFLSDAAFSGRDADGRVAGGWDTGDWTTAGECAANAPATHSSWHGTHVSGTVAALTDNGVALAGVAGGASVLPVRVLGHCGGPVSDIADAIVWAAGGHVDGVPDNTHPAQVINMSLGGPGSCVAGSAFADAIARADELGTTVVVAAGNDGGDAGQHAPASCPGAVTVAATGIDGGRAAYSNYGAAVDLAAPGGGICPHDGLPDAGGLCADGQPPRNDGFVWSLVNSGETTPVDDAGNGYVYFAGMAGTSQATPHVAAVAALVLDAIAAAGAPTPSPSQMREILTSSTRPFPIAPPSTAPSGSGIVDAYAAIARALGGDDGDPDAVPLTSGVPVGGLSGEAGDSRLFTIEVPAGTGSLSLRSYGGMGDVRIAVRAGSAPDDGHDDGHSSRPGNNESVLVRRPRAGTWYLRVTGAADFRDVSVLGLVRP